MSYGTSHSPPEVFSIFAILFRRIIKILLAFQLIHILDIIQKINVYRRNISVLNCEVITVSSRLIVRKCVSIGIKSYHKAITVGTFLIKFIYRQFIWSTNHRFKSNTCIVCIIEFQYFCLGIIYRNRDIEAPVTFIFVVASIPSIFFSSSSDH